MRAASGCSQGPSGCSFYNVLVSSWDVIIAGAGIIGVSLALELREQGAKVLVLERGEPGHEASSAAAGMLAASDPETPPALRPLALESARMFPEYVRKLEGLSGMSTDFRRQGAIVFCPAQHAPPAWKPLSSAGLHRLEPSLEGRGPAFLVEEDSVDPRLLMRAAALAAGRRGVEIRAHTTVKKILSHGGGVEVATDADIFFGAHAAVNCLGAWSGAPVRPRKGQMLYLQPEKTNLVQHVVRAPEVYIVPRSSGKILAGATVEDVGFDTTVMPSVIQELFTAAAGYLPELKTARIVESWAGLRPGTPDDLPLLGATGAPGIFAAGGHFRNGILLAPVTAKIMAEVIAGKTPSLEITAFAASRFAPGKT